MVQKTTKTPLTTEEPAKEKLEKFRQSQTKSKSWMWLGVIGISVIIFFFWGWSFITTASLFNWNRTQESGLVKKTQADWDKLFAETEKQQNKRKLGEQLNTIITEIKKQAEAELATTTTSTVNVSSTLEISTTTTSTIR